LRLVRKRFIAGAVCPQCEALDRIVVEFFVEQADQQELSRRRCVSCGFSDDLTPLDDTPALGVPKGRAERPRQTEVESEKVRILDPKDSL